MSATPGTIKSSAARLAVRVAKLGISIMYFVVCYVAKQLRGMAGRNQAGSCVILYYHNVPSHYRRQFEWQMQTLVESLPTVDLQYLNDLPADSHSVAITFDDGLQSFVENAVPVLARFGIPATVFVVARALGGKPVWGASYFAREENVATNEQLCNLPKLIAIGSHTSTHADLTLLNEEASLSEIVGSREILRALLRRPVSLFSFPFGSFNESAVRQCREAGYERVFTIQPDLLRAGSAGFAAGRVAADPWDWKLEFRLKIRGAYCWQSRVQELLRRLRGVFPTTATDWHSETQQVL